jgi:hypothetical protein
MEKGSAASVTLQQPYLRVVGLQEESDSHKDESFRWEPPSLFKSDLNGRHEDFQSLTLAHPRCFLGGLWLRRRAARRPRAAGARLAGRPAACAPGRAKLSGAPPPSPPPVPSLYSQH